MSAEQKSILYTSPPTPVHMSDAWYEIASPDHFWIRRRFHVLQKLADSAIRQSRQIAEVGCGNGLVQRCLEDHYQIGVTGFDLNELALQRSVCRRSQLYYYNVLHRASEFRERFDLIIMFDVLEHVADDSEFLEAVAFHLTRGGAIVINVPAIQFLFSDYDRVAGHFRRYSIRSLQTTIGNSALRLKRYTYWGAPLLPFLLLRKGLLKFRTKESDIISSGFDPGNSFTNILMEWIAACEMIPQHLSGTSLMAVVEKPG